MTNSNIIFKKYDTLNSEQRKSIETIGGPVLVIAGPGSGKSLVLILRTLYILMKDKAEPSEVLLCTFTEKAAFELKERIVADAAKFGYNKDLTDLKISTIHSLCNDYIKKYRHKTNLGNNFDVLDELTQLFFINEHFDQIIGNKKGPNNKYFGKWKSKWTTISRIIEFLNKISEELIDPNELIKSEDEFLIELGKIYNRYEDVLFQENKIDFSHQQKVFYEILKDSEVYNEITSELKYIMIDEYQDTNFIQEKIFLKLASNLNKNICVVGDDDQSLYRFRGATVRNIIEFKQNFPNNECKEFKLLVNYRSHKKVIETCQKFINSINWKASKKNLTYRHDKKIIENKEVEFAEYPAVFSIWGISKLDEANRVANLIDWLSKNRIIEDYSQVAILLKSVKFKYSKHYIEALNQKNIKSFCPRARSFFKNKEIKFLIGCFVFIFDFYKIAKGELDGYNSDYYNYLMDCLDILAEEYPHGTELAEMVIEYYEDIRDLRIHQTTDYNFIDIIYQLITVSPFRDYMTNQNKLRNLGTFTQLLNIFHQYYKYNIITGKNKEVLKRYFFHSFLMVLYRGGINEYEDKYNPIPKGHVQIMTIHQAKGLEFSVVITGSLDKRVMVRKQIDRYLSDYYHREPFEPLDKITKFDRMRLYYVAFSRAKHMLVLSCHSKPKKYFREIWEGLSQWPYVKKDILKVQNFEYEEKIELKKIFSLTSQVNVYETCPRQYKFFREYEFVPSRSAQMLFGTLVHETLEDINREVINGNKLKITEERIQKFFSFNYKMLLKLGFSPINQAQRENALNQCINYFVENFDDLEDVIDAELRITLERPNFILNGVIDVLRKSNGKYEIWDFKTQNKTKNEIVLKKMRTQLNTYAYLLSQKKDAEIEKLVIYWTSQKNKEDAITEFKYDRSLISSHINKFDKVVNKILEKDFQILDIPDKKTCNECDLKKYCLNLGTIRFK